MLKKDKSKNYILRERNVRSYDKILSKIRQRQQK